MDPLVTEERNFKPRRRVVLIVEENFLTRWSAAEYLRETGFDVIEAVCAAEALAAIRAGSVVDAVFCNADSASGVDGPEFLRLLEEQYPHLPVLLASEGLDKRDAPAPSPTRAHIVKPYSIDAVVDRIGHLLALQRKGLSER